MDGGSREAEDPHPTHEADGTGVARVSRDEVHRMVATGEPVTLVEALGPAYFADAHLPGAVNVPPDRVDALAARLLGDRVATVVVYCSGSCTSSVIVARRLVELGYRRVMIYEGGKEDWVEHGLPVERGSGPRGAGP